MKEKIKEANRNGIAFGFSQSGRIIFLGGAFYLGFIISVQHLGIDTKTVFIGTFIPFFSYLGVGAAAASIPSIESAKGKAVPIFSFIDEKSTLDSRVISEEKLSQVDKGQIEF